MHSITQLVGMVTRLIQAGCLAQRAIQLVAVSYGVDESALTQALIRHKSGMTK